LTAIDKLYAAALTMFEAQNVFVYEVEYRERNLGLCRPAAQPKRDQISGAALRDIDRRGSAALAFRDTIVRKAPCRRHAHVNRAKQLGR